MSCTFCIELKKVTLKHLQPQPRFTVFVTWFDGLIFNQRYFFTLYFATSLQNVYENYKLSETLVTSTNLVWRYTMAFVIKAPSGKL